MNWIQSVMVLYGVFDICMGLLGTIKAHEIASLLGGGIAGILVIGCAALAKTHPRIGYIAALVISLLVAGKFAPDTFRGTVYPAGIIFWVSILFAATLLLAHFLAMRRRKGREV